MQVQHEAQLQEGIPIRIENFAENQNKPLDSYILTQTALTPVDRLLSCPTNGNLIAAYYSHANQVSLFDIKSTPSRRDRFPLKSCDKKFSRQSFVAKGIDFSPDGQKLAIGQSDSIIYIYKLSPNTIMSQQQDATTGGGKPTITGKFTCSSPVTCLIWTECGIVFGTQDGKVKLISMATTRSSIGDTQTAPQSAKVISLHASSKNAMPISLSFKSSILAIGFMDNTVLLFSLISEQAASSDQQIASANQLTSVASTDFASRRNSSSPLNTLLTSMEHSCPPQYLIILQANIICCAGSDGRIAFHSIHSDSSQSSSSTSKFDASNASAKSSVSVEWVQNIDFRDDILAIDYSPINEIIVVCTKNKLQFIKFDQESSNWRLQSSSIEMANLLALTSVLWTRDGSQLVVGSLNGSIDSFRCSWSKQSISEQLDICHIAKNRVRITDRARNLLATYKTQYDIKRVNLLDNEQSVIIWTLGSLLLARLAQCQSEIRWTGDKNVKFCFDYAGFVLIFKSHTRELLLVRLGQDEVIYKVKLDQAATRSNVIVCQYPPSVSNRSKSPTSSTGNTEKTSPKRQRSASNSAKTSPKSATATPRQSMASEDKLIVPEIQQPESISDSSCDSPLRETVCERLAFVSDSNCLNLVDLRSNSKKVIEQHSARIVAIKFSMSGDYLALKDTNEKLHLIQLDENSNKLKSRCLVGGVCKFFDWIPQSDILIAQAAHRVLIWYSVEDLRANKAKVLDSRGYSVSNRPPILDLSLMSRSRTQRPPHPVVSRISAPDQVHLTNGRHIALDRLTVEFNQEIMSRGLGAAFEVLNREEVRNNLNLWYKIAWLAIERGQCAIAIKSFRKLDHKSMVKYLEACEATNSQEERDIRLAKLQGKWDSFENIAEAHEIVSTYKRLNKWTRLIEYLTGTQQFRQRDMAEQEFREWLMEKQRFVEAGQLQVKSGDLIGAIELLNEKGFPNEAAKLLVSETKTPIERDSRILSQSDNLLVQLATTLKLKLTDKRSYRDAATVCANVLGDPSEAIQLYLKGEEFNLALELAQNYAPDQLKEIDSLYGEHQMRLFRRYLLSRRKALAAIDHFVAAGNSVRALEAAIELRDSDKAHKLAKIVLSNPQNAANLALQAEQVANFMTSSGHHQEAIEILMLSQQYEQLVKLACDCGDFEKAFEVSIKHIHSDRKSASEEYISIAKRLSAENRVEEAEKIYLMLDEPDLAIEMHKEAGNFDRMLELTRQYHPDLLEANLFQVSKDLEMAGQHGMAEKYLLQVSPNEWTNVVRMYRLAGKWDEAYRVARANCASEQDPLLVQLAFWWSKSLVAECSPIEAQQLLKKLNVLSQVVEFCCENKNFQIALSLCDQDNNQLKREVLRRYAASLEQQHKFSQAEEILVANGHVELAARMYIDNDMQMDAIRVVEEQLASGGQSNAGTADGQSDLVELLNETLVQCAHRMAEEAWPLGRSITRGSARADSMDRLLAAQQLYLRAQRPELAVELYKQRALWQEAVQVAQRFAPRLLESVERALDEQVSADMGPIVATAAASRSSSRSSLALSENSNSNHNASSTQFMVVSAFSDPIHKRDHLHSQAESSMRNGNLAGARMALGKFVESIANGDEGGAPNSNSTGDLKANLVSRLEQLTRSAPTRREVAGRQPVQQQAVDLWVSQVTGLSDQICQSYCWTKQKPGVSIQWTPQDDFIVWLQLRDFLFNCLEELDHNSGQSRGQDEQTRAKLERRVLVAHFVTLHATLVNQLQMKLEDQPASRSNRNPTTRATATLTPSQADKLFNQAQVAGHEDIVNLLSKLSLSLLRYSPDLIEPKCALYSAGLWLLVAGRRQLACIVWTRLLELIDNLPTSRVERELQLLGIPVPVGGPRRENGSIDHGAGPNCGQTINRWAKYELGS